MPHGASFAVDVLAQFLWIPVGYVLLRLLRFRRRIALTALVFASFVPTILVNSVYTWPKMLSAALVLAAIGFMLSSTLTRSQSLWSMVLAVSAATLGVLAHGAAAFAVPALVIIALYTLRGRGIRSSLATLGMAALAGVVLYAPWFIYQRYVDPPGDRLLKWHFAGYIQVTPESFLAVLLRQYASTPLGEIVHNRVANVETFLGIDQLWRINDPDVDLISSLRVLDWTSTASALGIITVLTGIAALIWHSRHFRALDLAGKQRLLVLVSMLPCIALWLVVLFSAHASIVPQGSHVWILAMAIIPFAWLLERRPRLTAILLAIQALSCVSVYFVALDVEAPRQELALPQLLIVLAALVVVAIVPWLSTSGRAAKHVQTS
ncbi:hypothetical protein ITJ38_02790 [Agreia pratensis]|uniref:hypothetical protein n=1 Tax=Agreia pratensis TaxID=150121 RepID=UPI00188AB978|nr:hypothetical protein [Agreia pratensis]MBF4633325.1 hypothetical protein [Agreia pratensis]